MKRINFRNVFLLCLVMVCISLFGAAVQAASFSQQAWVASGPGTKSITPNSATSGVTLSYSMQGSAVWSGQSWQYSTTANQTESISYNWNYSGYHAYYRTSAIAKVFVDGPNGRVYTTLFDGSGGVGGGFNVSGVSTIQVNQGYAYGFYFYGKNYDSDSRLIGNFVATPSDSVSPVTTDNAPASWVNQDVTVSLSASDSGSGVAATYYSVNGGAQQNGNSVVLASAGVHTIQYWSVDNAGNT